MCECVCQRLQRLCVDVSLRHIRLSARGNTHLLSAACLSVCVRVSVKTLQPADHNALCCTHLKNTLRSLFKSGPQLLIDHSPKSICSSRAAPHTHTHTDDIQVILSWPPFLFLFFLMGAIVSNSRVRNTIISIWPIIWYTAARQLRGMVRRHL